MTCDKWELLGIYDDSDLTDTVKGLIDDDIPYRVATRGGRYHIYTLVCGVE